LQKELEKLGTERAVIAQTLSPEQTGIYDQLRQQRRGVAVASIVENACDACGSQLTLAQVQSERGASQLVRCPSCGRILYRN